MNYNTTTHFTIDSWFYQQSETYVRHSPNLNTNWTPVSTHLKDPEARRHSSFAPVRHVNRPEYICVQNAIYVLKIGVVLLMPTLSVIIPFYNTPLPMLQRCLAPFLSKAYSHVEVILVDDCSTLAYDPQITELIKDAPTTIHLHRHTHNAGHNAARATGIRHASGTYIAFLDSDDYLESAELSKVIDIMEAIPAQAYAIDALVVDENGNSVYASPQCISAQRGWLPTKEAIRKCSSLWHWVIKTDIVRAHTLNTSIRIGEDLVSLIPILADCNTIYSTGVNPYRYVHHDGSTMHTASLQDRLQLMAGFDTMLRDNPNLLQTYYDEVEWQAVWHILYWEALQTLQSQQKSSQEYKKNAQHWITQHFPNWHSNLYVDKDPQAKDIRFKLIANGHYAIFNTLSWLKHH